MSDQPEVQTLEKTRLQIARKVRELRFARNWTQAELASKLGLSQGRLSALERGTGSFTAEQLLQILALFNVAATHFAEGRQQDFEADLQNALVRLGATHLRQASDVLPTERLEDVTALVRETLASQSSRQIAALAPVLVVNIDQLSLPQLQLRLSEAGLERRLGWLAENTVEAIRREVPLLPSGPSTQSYRRAELLLGMLRDTLASRIDATGTLVDLLEPVVASKKTLDELRETSSPVSRRWGILTSLQVDDFVDALRAARDR
jgi:transcriptional regulator with XRE-family HTH domain